MTARPARLRRVQLAVPGASAKMLATAAASAADHVFCDLEDGVAPAAKAAARATVIDALTGLDWGKKTVSVRINDVTTPWCFEDVIAIVERGHRRLDTVIVPKVTSASDVRFVDLLLGQLEAKLGLTRRIGVEALIEDVGALARVDDLARASPRLEALILGHGDYAASHGLALAADGGPAYPGDTFYYPRWRVVMAARAAGLDPIDGPHPAVADEAGFRRECARARALGMVGKWAIHPAQIAPALAEFSPAAAEVARARRLVAAYASAAARGVGAVQVDGLLVDAATVRLVEPVIALADRIGM